MHVQQLAGGITTTWVYMYTNPFMKWKILKVWAGVGKSLQCVSEVESCREIETICASDSLDH